MIASKIDANLRIRRVRTEKELEAFYRESGSYAGQVRRPILDSWKRSPLDVLGERTQRLPDEYQARLAWEGSPLHQAAAPEIGKITQLARETPIVATLSDAQGTLLWTASSNAITKLAESLNFFPGTNWSEQIAGTNAISLTMAEQRSCTVFSAEHLLPEWHEIVCYAAPIIHPQSGQMSGILNISSHWLRYNPLEETAVAHLANNIAQRLANDFPLAELEIHVLGQNRCMFRGAPLHLSTRQLEILCILIMYPDGTSLKELHEAIYGDTTVSPATTKTVLTQLRHLLDGQIGSHPYRLLMPVWADFVALGSHLRLHNLTDAIKLYRGDLLPCSTAPAIVEWRHHIDAGMTNLLTKCKSPQTLIRQAGHLLQTPLLREYLLGLLV